MNPLSGIHHLEICTLCFQMINNNVFLDDKFLKDHLYKLNLLTFNTFDMVLI